jgi:hypothetical protein
MRAYKGVVEDGVVVLEKAVLPDGAVVTVTLSEGEFLRATLTNALTPRVRRHTQLNPSLNPSNSNAVSNAVTHDE